MSVVVVVVVVPFEMALNAPFLLLSTASILLRLDIGCSFAMFEDIFTIICSVLIRYVVYFAQV